MTQLSETRRKILEMIAQGEAKRVKDIEEALHLTRPGVIRHLKDSEAKGWIIREKEGRETRLRITPEGLVALGIPPEETYNDLLKNPRVKMVTEELLMAARRLTPEELIRNVVDRHGGIIKEHTIKEALTSLAEERIIKEGDDGRVDLSYLGLILLAKEKNGYTPLLNTYFKRLMVKSFEAYKNLLKNFISLPEEEVLIISPEEIVDILKGMDKELALFLRQKKTTITELKKDDQLFYELEGVLQEALFKDLMSLAIKKLPSNIFRRFW